MRRRRIGVEQPLDGRRTVRITRHRQQRVEDVEVDAYGRMPLEREAGEVPAAELEAAQHRGIDVLAQAVQQDEGDRCIVGVGDRERRRQAHAALGQHVAEEPAILLADEPTGNLDRETGESLHGLIRRLNQERGITVVVVTHNERLAEACDRTLRLEGGRLV